ncbi:MAG TPA: hypothetical protein VEA38_24405, partial [Terriglobales bacterium]|nr:hypothetical protein [Terriglobales bacterium]
APQARLLAITLATGLVVAAPYFVSYALSMARPENAEIAVRIGLERGRALARPSLKDVLLIVLAAAAAWRLRSRAAGFVLAFFVGYVLCRNVQLVTGFTVHSVHWGYRVGNIWSTVTIAVLAASVPVVLRGWSERGATHARQVITKAALAGLVIGPIALAGYQSAFARNTARAFVLPDGYAEAFAWIDRETPRDSVVATPSFETSMLLPVYTHANVYLPNAIPSMAPTAELVERLLLVYKAFDVPAAALAASLRPDPARPVPIGARPAFPRREPERLERHATHWYVFSQLQPSPAALEAIVARYEALPARAPRPFGPYRADYVWMSPVEGTKARLDVAAHPALSVVYRGPGGVTIAKVR